MEDTNFIDVKDIENVTIVLHVDNKSYAFIPKKGEDKEDCKQMRIALALSLLKTHVVYRKPLEDVV